MIEARIRKHFEPRRESSVFTLDVDFRAAKPVTVLFGPSGAGKTLTLDSIAGFVAPDSGRILLDNRIVFDAETNLSLPAQRRRCGYVFQNYALFPHMTLRQNLSFAAEMTPRRERHRKVAGMLEKFQLAGVAGRKPHEVSGGQKQRCSIARALIAGPQLLLLDEPARGLDAPLRSDLYEILRQVRAEFSTPMLLVTHSLEECFELADEMFVYSDGRIIQSGPPAHICAEPATLELARLLGIYNILPAEIRHLDPGRNQSVVRYEEWDLQGPYFPGHLLGDRVHIVVPPRELRPIPRVARPGLNQVASDLVRIAETPTGARLEFAGGLKADIQRAEYERNKHNKEWMIEFPPHALRVL